jgi:CRP-like cAMP-binding protein
MIEKKSPHSSLKVQIPDNSLTEIAEKNLIIQRHSSNLNLMRRKTSQSLDPYEREVTNLVNLFRKKSAGVTISKYTATQQFYVDMQISEDQYFRSVIYLLNKKSKNASEVIFIAGYLFRLTNLSNFFAKAYDNYDEVMNRIAYQMAFDNCEAGKLLFKTGDKGDNFYIILKGTVAVLVPHESYARMSEIDYIKYLCKLRKHGEEDLYLRCIQQNKMTYPIPDDDVEKYLVQVIQAEKPSLMTRALCRYTAEKFLNFLDEKVDRSCKITVESYLNIFRPEIDDYDSLTEIHNVLLYEYNEVTTLEMGEKFGDIALDVKSQKRSATIITIDDSYFGVLDKKLYDACVKEAVAKIRKSNINMILNSPLFNCSIANDNFERNYYINFVNKKYHKGQYIFKEGEKPRNLYFVKEGEFEIVMKKSIAEMNEIIRELGGTIQEREERYLNKNNSEFRKIFNQKYIIRLSLVKDKEILGLSDMILNDQFNCSVVCLSPEAEAIFLERKFFDRILIKEPLIVDNFLKLAKMKNKIMLDKIVNFKSIKMKKFYEKEISDIKTQRDLYTKKVEVPKKHPCVILKSQAEIFIEDDFDLPTLSPQLSHRQQAIKTLSTFDNNADTQTFWFERLVQPALTEPEEPCESKRSVIQKSNKKFNSSAGYAEEKSHRNPPSVYNVTLAKLRLDTLNETKGFLTTKERRETCYLPSVINLVDPLCKGFTEVVRDKNTESSIYEKTRLNNIIARRLSHKEDLMRKVYKSKHI